MRVCICLYSSPPIQACPPIQASSIFKWPIADFR